MKHLILLSVFVSLGCGGQKDDLHQGTFQKGDAKIRINLIFEDEYLVFADYAGEIITILKERALYTDNIFKDIYADYDKREIVVDIIEFNDRSLRSILVAKNEKSFTLSIPNSNEQILSLFSELQDFEILQGFERNRQEPFATLGWASLSSLQDISMLLEDAEANQIIDSSYGFAWSINPDEYYAGAEKHILYTFARTEKPILNAEDIIDVQLEESKSNGEVNLNFEFNEKGTQDLIALSDKAIAEDSEIMMIVNKQVIFAGKVRQPLHTGSMSLSGMTLEQLEHAKFALRLPSLPINLFIISEQSVDD